MRRHAGSRQPDRRGERGAVLLVLMVAVVIMMIMMGQAVQTWSVVLQREREAEFIARAREVVFAVQRYQKDHGALPTKMEQLMEPGPNGNSRYLRRPYKDPLTGENFVLLWMAPDGASLFRSDGKPSVTGSFRTAPAGTAAGNVDPAAAFNMQALTIPVGSPDYDPDKSKSLLDAYRKSVEEPVGSRTRSIGGVNVGSFDPSSQMLVGEGIGPIAGVATAMTGQAFREWKGHADYSGYEISIFSFKDEEQPQQPGLAPKRNMWEMPGQPLPDPMSPEGRKLLNTDPSQLGVPGARGKR